MAAPAGQVPSRRQLQNLSEILPIKETTKRHDDTAI
jgi:hypothetical protein